MGKTSEGLLNATLVICCVTVTVLSVKQQFFRPTPPPPQRSEKFAPGRPLPASANLGEAGLRIGSAVAPLRLVEFADFECPFCSVAAGELKEIREKYPELISIRFRHMIVPGHTSARPAALAAECAAEQGAFEPFYYSVFENYAKLSTRKLRELAKKAGVRDMAEFDRCVESERYRTRLDEDAEAARLVGVAGTPTWVLGDSVFGGMPALAQLEQWVQRARGVNVDSSSIVARTSKYSARN